MSLHRVDVRVEGDRVLVLKNGKLLFQLPGKHAVELGNALKAQGKKALENENPEGLVLDQALLMRLGAPLALTDNEGVRKEAFKESQYDTELRKHVTGERARGVRSPGHVFMPTVRRSDEPRREAE